MKSTIIAGVGILGSFIASGFGGWDSALVTLIIFMTIDYITGILVAGVFHKSRKTESGALESRAGWKGLCRKCVTLFMVLIAHRLDVALGIDLVRNAVVIGYIVNEAISIIENAGLMGLPIPNIIKKAIEVLKNKGDETNVNY